VGDGYQLVVDGSKGLADKATWTCAISNLR
jgi:hypothetical protein